jgi:hypothetical protein
MCLQGQRLEKQQHEATVVIDNLLQCFSHVVVEIWRCACDAAQLRNVKSFEVSRGIRFGPTIGAPWASTAGCGSNGSPLTVTGMSGSTAWCASSSKGRSAACRTSSTGGCSAARAPRTNRAIERGKTRLGDAHSQVRGDARERILGHAELAEHLDPRPIGRRPPTCQQRPVATYAPSIWACSATSAACDLPISASRVNSSPPPTPPRAQLARVCPVLNAPVNAEGAPNLQPAAASFHSVGKRGLTNLGGSASKPARLR